MSKKNYFLEPTLASAYDKARPSFHAETLKAYHQCAPTFMYERALDVGCGTGRACLALAEWSKEVVGLDSSKSMLDHAIQHERIHYLQGEAENLPFTDHMFDVVFVASSLHWFGRRKFFSQVGRVLKPGGKFLVYDSYVQGGLKQGFSSSYSDRFPRPYEDVPLVDFELDFFGLLKKHVYFYDFERTFTYKNVFNYFMTLSNISACLEKGEKSEDIKRDLEAILKSQSTGDPFKFQVQLTEIIKTK